MVTSSEIRAGLVTLITETERNLERFRRALAEMDGAAQNVAGVGTNPAAEALAFPSPSPKLPSNGTSRSPHRSQEGIAAAEKAALETVRAASYHRAKVVEVQRSLVQLGLLEPGEKDREFTRYLLRKLTRQGLLEDQKKGYFAALPSAALRAVGGGAT